MREVIDDKIVRLQVESSREDLWVPDGLCYSKGSRTKPTYFEEPTERMIITKSGNYTLKSAYAIGKNTADNPIPDWTAQSDVDWGYWDSTRHGVVITRDVYLAINQDWMINWTSDPEWQEGGYIGVRLDPIEKTEFTHSDYIKSFSINTGGIIGGNSGDGFIWREVDYAPSFTRLSGLVTAGTVIRPYGGRQYYVTVGSASWVIAGSQIEFMEYRGEDFFDVIPQHYVGSGHTPKESPSRAFGNTTSYVANGAAKVAEFMPNTKVITTQEEEFVRYTEDVFGNQVSVYTNVTVITDYLSTIALARAVEGGPNIFQTRMPVPVKQGDKVNFTGRWQVSRTGVDQANDFGQKTGLDLRTSLWGVGWIPDEYGDEKFTAIELMFYQAPLQSPGNPEGTVDYIFPRLPDATVPQGVTGVHLTFSYVETTTGQYATGTQAHVGRSTTYNSSSSPNVQRGKTNFYWNPSHHFPFNILIEPNEGYYSMTHELLDTGAGFESRKFFKNVRPGAELKFAAPVDMTCTISVYNYSEGVRGSLIGTFSAAANEVKTVTINPTGTTDIEIVSTDVVLIEHCLNTTQIDNETTYQNRISKTTFSDITQDVTKFSILREEGSMGSLTVDLASATLDPKDSNLLKIGRRVRLKSSHWGQNGSGSRQEETIFQGTIRKIRSEYDYIEDEPIIQIVCYDEAFEMENITEVPAFLDWKSYIPFVSNLGIDVFHNGFNWGGGKEDMPSPILYTPMPLGKTFLEALTLTRNTIKGHWYVNKKNQLILLDTSPTVPLVELSDAPGADMSYGNMKFVSDSSNTINTLRVSENAVDNTNFMDRTIEKGKPPPSDFNYPTSRKRTATFQRKESVELLGELDQTIEVIRGTGDIKDLWKGEYGPGFNTWAQSILDAYADPTPSIKEITVPIKSRKDLYYVSQFDLCTPLTLWYKGEKFEVKIKSIDMEIRPGKWTAILQFDAKDKRSFW